MATHDPTKLNHSQKDELILRLMEQLAVMHAQLSEQKAQLIELQGHLALNSKNSSKPANLLSRLRRYADDMWRFLVDPDVSFTNNIAERTVRKVKVKRKNSGCFRTSKGADTFCIYRSYLATMHKQGANLFDALTKTFQGAPPQPRLS